MKLVNIHIYIAMAWLFLIGMNPSLAFAQSMTLEQCIETAFSTDVKPLRT
jgi:hypothetical protein